MQKPTPGFIGPAPKRAAPAHLKYAGIKGAANLLRKHGHLDEVTHRDIVKHADRNMKKGK